MEHIIANVLKGSFYYFIRFISIFIFIMAFVSWGNAAIISSKLLKWIEKILIFNTFFILIGLLFEVKVFKSYHFNSLRFGYDGLFNKVNEVSYFYIILIVNLYYQYIKTKKKLLLLIYVANVSLLLGTKTIVLFLGLLLLFHIVFMAKQAKTYRYVVAVPIVLGIAYFKEIMRYAFSIFPFWEKLSTKYSLTTMLFSTRDLAFYRILDYFQEFWLWINYCVGGPFYTLNFHRSEMDGVDIFIFFGVLGTLLYLYMIAICFFSKKEYITKRANSHCFYFGFFRRWFTIKYVICHIFVFKFNANAKSHL